MARQNMSVLHIKQALGHRSVTSSQVYASVSDADAGRAIQAAFMGTF